MKGMTYLIELLAPVGSREALIAAVESGADAVYLAGKMFGARAYAANFDNKELAEAIMFAHQRNVTVDVAVNTLVDNSEFADLADYLRFLYTAGADAIIVQDLGVAKLAREIVPNLPLHASTQMTVHNIAGVKLLESLGFTRVVLSREVSLADIKLICANCKVEIEVFIHGALCVCYSGQCLMSGMIGGRSGNRGRCAQPCRLPYSLVDAEGKDLLTDDESGEYLLSPKDMNTLELMPELIEAGVTSFKIEGRMKRPEYVAVVVDTYRRRIDAFLAMQQITKVDSIDQKNLAQIFNRDFTTAYLKDRPGRRMISDRRPNNRGVLVGRVVSYNGVKQQVTIKLAENLSLGDTVEFWVKVGGRVNVTINEMYMKGKNITEAVAGSEVTFAVPTLVRDHDRVFKVFDAKLMEKARSFFQAGAPLRRFAVDIKVIASIGQPMHITITDEDGFYGEAMTEFIAEKALKRPLTEEIVRKQIERLGTTVFALRNFTCIIKGDVMVPVSEINEARRKAIEMLEASRLAKYNREPLPAAEKFNLFRNQRSFGSKNSIKPALCVKVDTVDKAQAAVMAGADIIMFGGESFAHQALTVAQYQAVYDLVKTAGKKLIIDTPRIVKEWQESAQDVLFKSLNNMALDGVSISNIGMLDWVKQRSSAPIQADASLNIYNNYSIDFLAKLGVKSVTLSPELNFSQIERIAINSSLTTECIVHGNLELMVSEYCAIGSYLGGLDAKGCSKPCENKQYYLLDRKNEKFPLVTDQYCRMHLLNGKELNMAVHTPKFGEIGVERLRIEGKYMTAKAVAKWTRLYKEIIELGYDHPMLLKEDDKLSDGQSTRGHYFRGVL